MLNRYLSNGFGSDLFYREIKRLKKIGSLIILYKLFIFTLVLFHQSSFMMSTLQL